MDGDHWRESLSWMVIEAGEYMTDELLIQAGVTDVNLKGAKFPNW